MKSFCQSELEEINANTETNRSGLERKKIDRQSIHGAKSKDKNRWRILRAGNNRKWSKAMMPTVTSRVRYGSLDLNRFLLHWAFGPQSLPPTLGLLTSIYMYSISPGAVNHRPYLRRV